MLHSRIALAAAAALALHLPTAAFAAASAKALHGAWALVSLDSTDKDGKRTPSNLQKGLFIFLPNGHYALQLYAKELPKFASGNRMTGTPEENKAVVQGTLAHFGTYKVDEKAGTLTILPEGSSFPNWTGKEQPPRKISISGDQLTLVNPAPSAGAASSELVFKRVK